MRLVAVEEDLRLALLIDLEDFAVGARARIKRSGLRIECEGPDVFGASDRRKLGGLRARAATSREFVEFALGERSRDDVAIPGDSECTYRHLTRGRDEG